VWSRSLFKGGEAPDRIGPTNNIPHLKATSNDLRRCLLLQMGKQQCKTTRKMKNKENMLSPKDNSSLIIELKGMDFSDLPGKEFKTAVLKKLKSATRKLSPVK